MNNKALLQQKVFLEDKAPIDIRGLRYDRFLVSLQGNILKGHGSENTMHVV